MKKLLFITLVTFLSACNNEPQPIMYGVDLCHYCKMTIMDKKFGAELINKKGKALKFDSGECMVDYMKTDKDFVADKFLVVNYATPEELIQADKSFFLHGGNVNSPMGGQLAAFKTREDAEKFQEELQGDLLLWSAVTQVNF
jgi:copper chaperone NosL